MLEQYNELRFQTSHRGKGMTLSNREARAHHFVPQCWLAGFTDSGQKDGMLFVSDLKRKKQWRCKPSEVGHRRDFNRVEDPALPDPLAIEKIFSRIESTFVLYRGLWTLRDAVP